MDPLSPVHVPIVGMEDECIPKVGPSQYCLHSGPSFFPQGAGLRTVLGLAASWPPPTTHQWDSCEPNHLQTLTNISWRQTFQANHSRQKFISEEKNTVHTSWRGRSPTSRWVLREQSVPTPTKISASRLQFKDASRCTVQAHGDLRPIVCAGQLLEAWW